MWKEGKNNRRIVNRLTQTTRQIWGTHNGALLTVHTEGTENHSDIHAHTDLLSKSIAEDPDECAATSREYYVLRYESPISLPPLTEWLIT